MARITQKNYVTYIQDFESGDIDYPNLLGLFSFLIKNKLLARLQGNFQRTAQSLFSHGYLSQLGEVLVSVAQKA